MAKYKVNYTETYTKTYIVEANSPEEAQEKMECAAENVSGLIDTAEDFNYWDVEVEREADTKDLDNFEYLREDKI